MTPGSLVTPYCPTVERSCANIFQSKTVTVACKPPAGFGVKEVKLDISIQGEIGKNHHNCDPLTNQPTDPVCCSHECSRNITGLCDEALTFFHLKVPPGYPSGLTKELQEFILWESVWKKQLEALLKHYKSEDGQAHFTGVANTRSNITIIAHSKWPQGWELVPVNGVISGIEGVATSMHSKRSIIIEGPEGQIATWKAVMDLRDKVAKYGQGSSEVMQMIKVINADLLVPYDTRHLAQMLLQPVQLEVFEANRRQLL
ncbi:hypothetical protein DUI87_30508 [Hirundo rustica rustica]|uniref:Uncharacterized protein n=1 Tax=Hirundo rustica rustica TaxID=333673 RepID=A0A3M0IWY8_HIRRU|nr:hypothetical protein DUI87_30508 [Hirundo rustica rustica]